jgi:hypothetical protein
MISLKSLIFENNDDDLNADLYDDWIEYLGYNEYNLPQDEIKKLIKKFNLRVEKKLKKILILSDNKKTEYLEYNSDEQSFDYIKDISEWVINLNENEMENLLGMDINSIYSGYIECTLNEMMKNPGKVYHYTNEDSFEEIKESGLIKGSYGTGLANRYITGIFTSVNPEEYADGTYGNICLELDLDSFKKENNLSKIDLSYEPEVSDFLLKEQIVSSLELENEINVDIDSSSGISPYTIIVHENIPLKYIKEL